MFTPFSASLRRIGFTYAENKGYNLRKGAEIMSTYIHELKNWPSFYWNDSVLSTDLAAVRHRQGKLLGKMESLGFRLREESTLRTLTEEVVKSSEIEGEHLDRDHHRLRDHRKPGDLQRDWHGCPRYCRGKVGDLLGWDG